LRLKLTIQYDGTDFSGWQFQPGLRTIQGLLQDAVSAVEEVPTIVHGAGRTDAGVHALGQVGHVDVLKQHDPDTWVRAINAHLDRDVQVMAVSQVPDSFHARRSAIGKAYRYQVWTGAAVSPLVRHYVAHSRVRLDLERMREAARVLVGKHDFEAFTVTDRETKTTVRDLRRLEIVEEGDSLLSIQAEANGFLRAMVRTLAGTLMAIGDGRLELGSIEAALRERRRDLAGPTAPAAGLTLLRVDY